MQDKCQSNGSAQLSIWCIQWFLGTYLEILGVPSKGNCLLYLSVLIVLYQYRVSWFACSHWKECKASSRSRTIKGRAVPAVNSALPEQECKTRESATVQWLQLVLGTQPCSGRSLCQSQRVESSGMNTPAEGQDTAYQLITAAAAGNQELKPGSCCPSEIPPAPGSWPHSTFVLCCVLNAESVHVLQAADLCSRQYQTPN